MGSETTVYDYMDYRVFLNDCIEEKKKVNTSYSMRALASRIQCEPGFFNRILRGERNLMAAHVVELGKVLKLTKKEQHYFELLVSYNNAKKQIERDHYFEQMQQFKKMNVKQVNVDQYALYSHWYFLVIRELLNIVSCQKDSEHAFRQIARMLNPSISVAEVRDAIEALIKLGVIKELDDKTLELTDTFTTSGTEVPLVIINRFLLEFADLARRAVDVFPRTQRRFSTLTFSISKSGFQKISDRIDEFRREILSIIENDQEKLEQVYHLNFHLFPVTNAPMENNA